MRFPTYRVCPRLVVPGFRVEADVLHSDLEFGWNMKMVERYMSDLFATATRFVIIHSSNTDRNLWFRPKHVRHRSFTDWVQANEPEWTLQEIIRSKYPLTKNDKNGSLADFFIYRKSPASGSGCIHE